MTEQEAVTLMAELRDAYPAANLQAETVRLYVRDLRTLRVDLGREAVRAAIHSCRFLPTLAELHHHYGIAAEQNRRRVEEERTWLERLAEDNMERPALKDIPAALEHLAKLRGAEDLVHLEPVEAGLCDDCRRDGPRFNFLGKLGLCLSCISARLRVRAEVA